MTDRALIVENRMLKQQIALLQKTILEQYNAVHPSKTDHRDDLSLQEAILRVRILGEDVRRHRSELSRQDKLAHEAYQKGLRDASGLADAVEWCGANRATVEFTHSILPYLVRLSYPERGAFPIEGASLEEAVRLARMGENAEKI
jgi:hypothetical protein